MIVKKIEKKSPYVYSVLKKSLEHDKVAHAYLLVGQNEKYNLDIAFLLAQSIIEDKNDFACQICNTCKNIKDNNYADLIYIDGSKESIKKTDIIELQEKLLTKGVLNSGKKIYIINTVENTSSAALNSMLKLLEEPHPSIYAILITQNETNVLDTIVSRCQLIKTYGEEIDSVIKEYLEIGTNSFLSNFLSYQYNYFDEAFLLDENLNVAYDYFESFIKAWPNNLDSFLYHLEKEVIDKDATEVDNKISYLLKMIIFFIKDFTLTYDINDTWYQEHKNRIKQIKNDDIILEELISILDNIQVNYDTGSLMYKLVFKMKEYL